MSRPISRAELRAMMAEALARYDARVRAQWERICLEPEKWKCSPWGDETGGFWAVAIQGNQVLWYNDIEEGFNLSRFEERGVIGEYWCNQDEFVDILERFAQAHADEVWSRVTPGAVPPQLAAPGLITLRQTTYCDVRSDAGVSYRVHFRDKAEFLLSSSRYSTIDLFDDHPLLRNYDEPWASVYVAGRVQDPVCVADQIDESIRRAADGWRTLEDYKNELLSASEVLRSGYGLVLDGPESICQVAANVIAGHGAGSSIVGRHRRSNESMHVLVIGRDYVVARAFAFERKG